MIPTKEQIEAEVAKLREMAPRIRQRSSFGDDNRAKIDAQIAILSGEKTLSYFEVDETCEDFDESDSEIFFEAKAAHDWMTEGRLEDGPLSAGWEKLLPEAGV